MCQHHIGSVSHDDVESPDSIGNRSYSSQNQVIVSDWPLKGNFLVRDLIGASAADHLHPQDDLACCILQHGIRSPEVESELGLGVEAEKEEAEKDPVKEFSFHWIFVGVILNIGVIIKNFVDYFTGKATVLLLNWFFSLYFPNFIEYAHNRNIIDVEK